MNGNIPSGFGLPRVCVNQRPNNNNHHNNHHHNHNNNHNLNRIAQLSPGPALDLHLAGLSLNGVGNSRPFQLNPPSHAAARVPNVFVTPAPAAVDDAAAAAAAAAAVQPPAHAHAHAHAAAQVVAPVPQVEFSTPQQPVVRVSLTVEDDSSDLPDAWPANFVSARAVRDRDASATTTSATNSSSNSNSNSSSSRRGSQIISRGSSNKNLLSPFSLNAYHFSPENAAASTRQHFFDSLAPPEWDLTARLPDELALQICRYLSLADLCRLAATCRRWREICSDKTLWHGVDVTLTYFVSPTKSLRQIYCEYRNIALGIRPSSSPQQQEAVRKALSPIQNRGENVSPNTPAPRHQQLLHRGGSDISINVDSCQRQFDHLSCTPSTSTHGSSSCGHDLPPPSTKRKGLSDISVNIMTSPLNASSDLKRVREQRHRLHRM